MDFSEIKQENVFGGFSSDLPSIAAMAASDVDNLIRNKSTGVNHLEKLIEVLTASFGDFTTDSGATPHLMLDPVSTSVITKAVINTDGNELRTYSQLKEITKSLTKKLERVESGAEMENSVLLDLKKFCLSLSKHALASSEFLDESYGPKFPDFQR